MPSTGSGSAREEALQRVLVDAHVHIYPCFEWGECFGSAWRNFAAQGPAGPFANLLLLTETWQDHAFDRLAELAHAGGGVAGANGTWSVSPTRESESLAVAGPEGQSLVLIAGRQIQTREGLEVLALGSIEVPPDGLPLAPVVEWVRAAGALPAIPWGFGKWWGRRGSVLERYLNETDGEIFLGDNSGRPWFYAEPRLFKLARRKRIPILPGSDPLPLTSESGRAGSFGFAFTGWIDAGAPWGSLRAQLRAPDFDPSPYGPREKALRFVRNQALMQLRRRREARGVER